MLRKDLTVETGLKEIGTVIEKKRQRLGPESPYTRSFKALVNGFSRAVDVGEMERWSDRSWNRTDKCTEQTREKIKGLIGDFNKQQAAIIDYKNYRPQADTSSYNESILKDLHGRVLTHLRPEAIMNALEHGTDFARESDVILETAFGTEGILSVVSQRTAGVTRDKIEEMLNENNPYSTLYWEKNEANEKVRIRGSGMTDFRLDRYADVGFEPYTRESKRFRTIILGTLASYDRA